MRAKAPVLASAALSILILVAWVRLDGPRQLAAELATPDLAPEGIVGCSRVDSQLEADAFRLAGQVVRASRWCDVDHVVVEVDGDLDDHDHIIVVVASSVASETLTLPFSEAKVLAIGSDGWLAVGIVQASEGALSRGGVWFRVTDGAPRP